MPGMDGLQTSRHIKSDETLTHPPAIVLVTAFGREEVREEAERLQLDGFLVKPVTKSMIVDTLVNVFAHEGEAASVTTEGEQAMRLRGARILLTEDNEINQQIAVELARRHRRDGESRQQRTRGGGYLVQRTAAAAVRCGADGPANAGDGRLSGDRQTAFRRAFRSTADHRHDGARHDRRTPALSRLRDERSYLETNRSQCAVRNRGAVLSVRPGNVGICSSNCQNLGPGCQDGRRSRGGVAR